MPESTYEIVGLEVQSLAGYRRAVFDLRGSRVFLLGPNNSGKTTALRLLDWSVNGADSDLLNGTRKLNPSELDLLHPARDTRGTGRRLTIRAKVEDGREARGFGARNGIAELRIRILEGRAYASHERPRRGERRESSTKGVELHRRIAENNHLRLIDASRDATSASFASILNDLVGERTKIMGVHRHQGGAPLEYRETKEYLEKIWATAEPLLADLGTDLQDDSVTSLLQHLHVEFDLDQEKLVSSLASSARIRITTGTHDSNTVSPDRVGSGLQSLLQVAAIRSLELPNGTNWLLMDEPESHLHPSTQRHLSQLLSTPSSTKLVASTHSPFIVEEANYRDLVVVMDHVVHDTVSPDSVERSKLENLVAAEGAEALFYSSILLLEGPGDVRFMNALRRRLGQSTEARGIHSLFAVATGGKTSFGVWLRLLRSFRSPTGDQPWTFLAVCDGVDAATDIRKGLVDGTVPIPGSVESALLSVPMAFATSIEAGIDAAKAANNWAVAEHTPVHLWEVDLEYAALRSAKPATVRQIGKSIGGPSTRKELLGWLGSKFDNRSKGIKSPWMRSEIGQLLPWAEVSDEAKEVLTRWIEPVVDGRIAAENLVSAVES